MPHNPSRYEKGVARVGGGFVAVDCTGFCSMAVDIVAVQADQRCLGPEHLSVESEHVLTVWVIERIKRFGKVVIW